jgi:Raf kinase inhibitor-like YbhB/YbcL family protein
MTWKIWLWCGALVLCCGCQRGGTPTAGNDNAATEQGGAEKRSLRVTSEAFAEGGLIPAEYTCAGANVSPPLKWGDVPAETKSLALVVDDPDAPRGTWVHWVVYNLPAATKALPASIAAESELPGGGRQGRNDFGQLGYGGPCPPSGTHRYYFKLYALNVAPDLPPGATKQDLLRAMYGHILDEGQLIGKFKR